MDFCCPAARLVVEVVGPAHDDEVQWAYDQRRYAWLEIQGYRVVPIAVQEIDVDIAGVLDRIAAELLQRQELGFARVRSDGPAPPPPDGGTSPLCGEDYLIFPLQNREGPRGPSRVLPQGWSWSAGAGTPFDAPDCAA